MRHIGTTRCLGSHAPSSVALVLAISVTFSLLTACGESEDYIPSPDAGHEIGNGDVSGDVAGDVSPDTDEGPTYPEVCAECTARGEECPTPEEFRILRQGLAGTVSEIADEVCVFDPCEDFYGIADYVWVCDEFDVGETGDTLEVQPDGDQCDVWWDWRSRGLKRSGIIADARNLDVTWVYHGPGSMSRYTPDGAVAHCTGTPKEE